MPIFDPAHIQAAVSAALAAHASDIPMGHTGALIAVVDVSGAKLVIAHRISDGWEIDGTIQHPWSDGPLEAGVTIHGSW